MKINELKKELGISNKEIAEFFELNESSYANSSAKKRYENTLCKFYAFVKIKHLRTMDKLDKEVEVFEKICKDMKPTDYTTGILTGLRKVQEILNMEENEIKEDCLQESEIDLGRYSHSELTQIKDAMRRYHNTKLKIQNIPVVNGSASMYYLKELENKEWAVCCKMSDYEIEMTVGTKNNCQNWIYVRAMDLKTEMLQIKELAEKCSIDYDNCFEEDVKLIDSTLDEILEIAKKALENIEIQSAGRTGKKIMD